MKRLNVDIEDKLHTGLKVASAQTGETMSDIVTRCLEDFLTVRIEPETTHAEPSIDIPKVIKTPEDALEAIESIQETATRAFMGEEIKFCKNGHPMNKFGDRCLDKKCKYA